MPFETNSKDVVRKACFRTVADSTYDWEGWHGPDGQLLWVNPAVERMTGYSPDECLKMPDYPFPMTAEESRPKIAEIIAEAIDRTSRNDVEFEAIDRNGNRRRVAISWQPMYDESGRHLGFRTSIRDMTERHQLREQLRQYAEHLENLVQERTARIQQLEQHRRQMEKLAALGQLAAGVAHEINNPLAGIRNAFELIKSDLSPEHEHFELLELIDREIERISSIVLQMYQLYGPSRQQPREFCLHQAVTEVVTLLESVSQKQRVTLTTQTPILIASEHDVSQENHSDSPPSDGIADPSHWRSHSEHTTLCVLLPEGPVKQILYNLIHNAILAAPAGTEVTIGLETNDREVRVTVTDRGPGISEDMLPRIFDPFFTTRASAPGNGMGLGLSVSRNLIEAMGGSISVETRQGDGSRFTAAFPKRMESHTDEISR